MRLVLSIVVALATGCVFVNDPSQHMGGAPPIPSNELCRRIVSLQCRGYLDCCPSAPDDRTVEQCMAPLLAGCTDGLGALLADERTGYDPIAAGRAVAEAEAMVDVCSLGMAEWAISRDGVFQMFGGTVPSGGQCTPRGRDDVGALLSCDVPTDACTAAGSVERFVCAERFSSGPCLTNYECAPGFACILQTPGVPASGECMPLSAVGTPCRESVECASFVCARDAGAELGTCIEPTTEVVYCGSGS